MIAADDTCDDFLGGAVKLVQPRKGYRAAMDTVLVAAAVAANANDRILDLGVGTGGIPLCLAARLNGLPLSGIDDNAEALSYAEHNARANDVPLTLLEGDIRSSSEHLPRDRFDHVVTNPPFHDPSRHEAPPDAMKARAHREGEASLGDWIQCAHRHLVSGGYLTLIFRADRLPQLITAMDRRFGDITIFPLWPRPGQAARRVIVQARKDRKGAARLLAGLSLHGEASRYSKEVEAVLRSPKLLRLEAD